MRYLLIYNDAVLTEEQANASPEEADRGAAHHDFFARRYNIDANLVVRLNSF